MISVVQFSPREKGVDGLAVTTEDLDYLSRLVEVTDGGPTWRQMMDKSVPNMYYQAWQRDLEVVDGPIQLSILEFSLSRRRIIINQVNSYLAFRRVLRSIAAERSTRTLVLRR